jgi:nucleoside-diphosphate-sugar epimerase
LPEVEVRPGSIGDPNSLRQAMDGITHVIHCAGATKAIRVSGFYDANQAGTRAVIDAINSQSGKIQRVVHISSLAAAGPALREMPAREDSPPRPVSEYGKSKLAGELEVSRHCRAEYVILRPPAVYGPRDVEFLRLFKAVKRHLLPKPSGGQALSMIFVKDLAEAVVTCLTHPAAAGKTYFVASRDVVTARAMAEEIAAQMKVWTIQEILSRLTGKPSVLSLQKFAELRAPGWVCDPSRLERETGCVCATTLKSGIAQTLSWYRQNRWL